MFSQATNQPKSTVEHNPWSTSSDTHQVVEIQIETSSQDRYNMEIKQNN